MTGSKHPSNITMRGSQNFRVMNSLQFEQVPYYCRSEAVASRSEPTAAGIQLITSAESCPEEILLRRQVRKDKAGTNVSTRPFGTSDRRQRGKTGRAETTKGTQRGTRTPRLHAVTAGQRNESV